ncbi:SDR family NAD(P)-dependent oxidoreductase [Nocardioides immobilis]|nr:SDR family NAD(P)-dependent oxidoreductase [Nocardioides immobilis]
MSARTEQRRWLITGVSSGLGRALAQHLLGRGDTVLGTLRKQDQAREFEDLAPGRSIALLLDLSDHSAISVQVPEAVDRVGGLDVLVNNAGYSLIGAIEETSDAEADEIMAVNFFGAVRLTRAVLPYFRKQHAGHVVNVSSLAGTIGFPWTAMYSASKSALATWSDALAAETASFGVKVTCLEPGGLRTSFASSSLQSTRASLPEYAEPVAAVKQRYAAAADQMPNDPDRAAAVIAGLVAMEDPPLRAALGADGHAYLGQALQQRLATYAEHRASTAAIAFEAAATS